MNEHLRTDICGLGAPGIPGLAIDTEKINHALQVEIQYACLYWVYHLEQAGGRLHDGDQVHDFLRHHFLHWLEALSLIGRASESIALIKTLQTLIEVCFVYSPILPNY
jgi:hypothetical protein